MKKFTAVFLAFILLAGAAALSGCSAKLADSFNQDEVVARAKEVVAIINTLDYAAMTAQVRDDLQAQLTPEQLKSAWDPMLTKLGAFKSFKNVVAVGQKDKNTGEDYAVTVSVCEYENGTATYTLSFDTNLKLVGMYMK